MLKLSFLRHGETLALTQGLVLRGALDDPLTPKGIKQMQYAWENFAQKSSIQAVISSDLSRCANFAKQIAEVSHLPWLILPQLRELHFGDWEGKLIADLYKQYPQELAVWWQTPSQFTPPNGESLSDFATRIDDGLAIIKAFAIKQDIHHLLVVSHGGVIKYLMCQANHGSFDDILKYDVKLGTIYTFSYDDTLKLL